MAFTAAEATISAAKTAARLIRWALLIGFVAGMAVGSLLAWVV